MNFLIALPAAIVTFVLYLVFGRPDVVSSIGNLDYSLIKVFPYILVLALALLGTNVFIVLIIGIFSAGLIGIFSGSLTVVSLSQQIWIGFNNMNEAFFLALFCGGISEIAAHYGGITWLIHKLRVMIKGKKSAELGISALVSLVDCATANNTIAIISKEYDIDPRRSASLLDIFSCVFQGTIPYGAQLLTASALASKFGLPVSMIEIVPYVWYCWILAVFALISIYIPYDNWGSSKKQQSEK